MSSIYKPPESPWRATIETATLSNSISKASMAKLYELSTKQPNVVVTSHPIYNPKKYGLPDNAKVLVSNDGQIVGRTAKARRLAIYMTQKEKDHYLGILREAVYNFNYKQCLHLEGVVGLHSTFMIKAHLFSPINDAKNMLDWGFNFNPWMEPIISEYKESRVINEPDILVLADPEWKHKDYPNGLVLVDQMQNCIAILGLRYFGERKKGTLTLGWAIGVRQNMVACHGGIKKIGNKNPIAVFGLSGSGKSSITNDPDHAGTLNKDEVVTVVHDDAFLIDLEHNISISLEPNLFDKTDAVKYDDANLKYFYSAQNIGVTKQSDNQLKMICQDIRNPNGRCIKSRDMFPHKNSCERPSKVIWLQKDTSLPPISKVKNNIALAVAMGASLSTMRAKGVENVNPEELKKLVIEPFANPFRVHPLRWDCEQFKKLFKSGTDCYIMNTYAFGLPNNIMDIPKTLSLKIVTHIIKENIKWKDWDGFYGLQIPENASQLLEKDYDIKYTPTEDELFLQFLKDRLQDRINFLSDNQKIENDIDTTFINPLVVARSHIDQILYPI